MGVLVEVESQGIELAPKRLPALLSALRALAEESPSNFHFPRAVVAAKDLDEALSAASWGLSRDKKGRIVGVRYAADKAPADASDLWPSEILSTLAPFVTSGQVVVRFEGEPRETVYRFAGGRVASRRRKRTAAAKPPPPPPLSKQAVDAAVATLPPESFGIEWRIRFAFENAEWYRDRGDVAALIAALAETKLWSVFDALWERDKQLPVKPKLGALPTAEVVKLVANAQWRPRYLTRRDGEASLEIDVSVGGVALRLRVRDGVLRAAGAAVVDDLIAVVRTYMQRVRGKAFVLGHAGPFGRKHLATLEDSPLVDSSRNTSGELHLRADAIAHVLDRRTSRDEGPAHKDVRALASATAPAGARRNEADDVVVVSFPCDVSESASVRSASRASEAWLGEHLKLLSPPPAATAARPAGKKRSQSDARLHGYHLFARFELSVDDDPYYFREPAVIGALIRALARTAWWPELAKGTPEKVLRTLKLDRDDTTLGIEVGTSVRIMPNPGQLAVVAYANHGCLRRLGRHALRDLVDVIAELRGVLAGRGQLIDVTMHPDSDDWWSYCGVRRKDSDDVLARAVDLAHVVDPRCAQDGSNGLRLHHARLLASALVPTGVERIERDGLVALLFAEDLSDPVATAEACARHASWLEGLRRKPARA